MHAKPQALDDAWALTTSGHPKRTVQRLTGVSKQTTTRMVTVWRKLQKQGGAGTGVVRAWQEAHRAATALGTPPPPSHEAQAFRLAGKLRKAVGKRVVPADVLATAVALLVGGMNLAANEVRGVRHDDQTVSA